MTFTIRKAVENDIEKIKPHIEEFNLDSEGLDCRNLYIVEQKGILAGFGRYKNHGNFYEIASIGVLKKFRDMGVGKMIVKNLIETVPKNKIWITTIIPDYFKKFGFEKSDDIPQKIALKAQRICRKFNKPVELSVFMQLKK